VHLVEQEIVDDGRHVDRRGAQKNAAPPELDEVDIPIVVDAEQETQFVAQGAGAAGERRDIFGLVLIRIAAVSRVR
jgi:hypothetical protein